MVLLALSQFVGFLQVRRLVRFATKAQVDALNTKTIVFGVLTALVALAVAAFIARLIAHEGGANPRDPQKRRVWYWSVLGSAAVAFFSYHQFAVLPAVAIAWSGRFLKFGMIPGVGALVVVYVLLGLLMSRVVFSSTKLSGWFPRSRR
jgi:hypothetical protein